MQDLTTSTMALAKAAGKALSDRAVAIRGTIDFSNRLKLATFGDKAQKAATQFSDRILSVATRVDPTDPDAVLNSMMAKARELDGSRLKPRKGLISKHFDNPAKRISEFRGQYVNVSDAIDRMAIEVERQREAVREDIFILEGLYLETGESIRELDDHIVAAEDAIKEMRETTIPAMHVEGSEGIDGLMAAQGASDAEQATDRLEKRVMQLKQARQIAFQQLPQIRIVQSGDETLIQNLDAALDLVIPAWKQKMVVLLGVARQGKALATDRALADATGRMMKETAEIVRSQAFEIEQRSQSGIVDVSALEETNAILINTITDLVAKRADARSARLVVGERIETMKRDLTAAFATNAA